MSLYSALRQVLAPFAAKIKGIQTGYDGTEYNSPGEAVRGQINDLHVLIGDEPGTAIQASAVAYGDSDVGTELTNVNGRLQWYPLAVNVTDGSYVVGSTGGIDTNANLSYAEVSVLAFRGKGITIQSYLWEGAGFAFLDANGAYIYGESANTKGITPDAGVLTKVETSVPYNAYSLRVTLHQRTYAANANRYFFTIGENKATKVVFIGDSYGTGYNTGGSTTGWIPGTAAALGLKSSDFEIHAKGGAGFRHPANITPYETFTDLLNLSTLAKAEVGKIVVCGGYNEQLYTVSQLLEAFGTFAAKAKEMYPFAEICIGMIGHSGKASEQETLMNTVRQGYMQMANRAGVRYLSNVEYVLTDDNVSSDGIHPDQTGADNLATAIGNAVKTGSASGKSYQSEITELDGSLHDLKDNLGYGEVITDITIPDGYKSANYQNSAGTIKLFYANDVLTFLMKWTNSEAISSYGRLGINNAHVALTVNDTLRFRLRSVMDAELRYRTQATDNYASFNIELRAYNSDYSAYKSVYVPFPSGTETLNRLNLSDFVTDNEIDISVYYNLVIYGLYWTQHTTAAGETATLTIVGYGPAGGIAAENIVEKVDRLESELDEQGETVDGFAADISANSNRITTVENLLLMNESEPGAVVNLESPNTGYVMDSGRIVADASYGYTDLIPVVGGAEYKFTAFIFGGVGLSWYDSTGTYISGVSGSTLGGTQFSALTFTLTAPDNAAYIRISHKIDTSKVFTMQQLTDVDTSNIIERFSEKLGQLNALPNLNDGEIYFACGDSITHANHNGVDKIDLTDPYMPSGGTEGYTYNTKNYAYYIARRHFLKWYNFGIGGTTLTECSVAGVDMKGFATPNGRYTQLANGVTPDYITIFFGWNDKTQGPIQQREIWLENEYGSTIYYPQTASKIGTTGYATQAQYDACNAVTGEVGGVTYNDNAEYFFAKFIGTIADTDPKTWYGAWNTVLPYLMQKYPIAKIMPIVPYSSVQNENSILGINLMMKQAVRNVAEKWGLAYFDFDSDEHQEFLATNTTPIGSYANIKAFRKAYLIADAVHPTNGGYKYMSNMIGSKLFAV